MTILRAVALHRHFVLGRSVDEVVRAVDGVALAVEAGGS